MSPRIVEFVGRTAARAVAVVGARALRLRPLVRTPLMVYRLGCGAVFGSRMLLLEHTGRRSGLRREVVLEVVARPAPGRFVVVSGFGERAQWYRNVRADPVVRVSVGRERSRPATARVLDADEADRVLGDYAASHRRSWRWFAPILEATLDHPVGAGTPPPTVELTLAQRRVRRVLHRSPR